MGFYSYISTGFWVHLKLVLLVVHKLSTKTFFYHPNFLIHGTFNFVTLVDGDTATFGDACASAYEQLGVDTCVLTLECFLSEL